MRGTSMAMAFRRRGRSLIRERRVPSWLAATSSLLLVASFGYLRLGVFPDRFVPLASVLALLVCLWHRDVRILWAMVAAFLLMVVYKVVFLVPGFAYTGNEEWLFAAMQATNLVLAAGVIHLVIRLGGRLEDTALELGETASELEIGNEELAAREEEVTRQNEELQSQAEELEQQTEELNSQTEELHALNEQLAEREGTLQDLLDLTGEQHDEAETLDELGRTIGRLLGDRAAGAAILERDGAGMVVRPLFGLKEHGSRIERERALAELVLGRGRAGSLPDVELRPDLLVPALLNGDRPRSLAAAPLRYGREHDGALEVYSADVHEWSDHELRLVQWLADQCGRMLANFSMMHERESLLESERAARAEAERANRAKDEFVATLSHELRTPLQAVLGWAAVLRSSGAANPSEVLRGLEVIERNARQQSQLVSDLLDISAFMVGKLKLDVQAVDVPLVVERALDAVRQAAEARGVRLEREVGILAREVRGDPSRLQQVVWNLLSNAIKFSPPGSTVRISVAEHASHVAIRVRDDGEGIDPDLLPLLFERYRQADGSSTRRHGGLGLGLAIVKNLTELHGGSVEARSDGLGKGSEFTVRLPIRSSGWIGEEPEGDFTGSAPITTHVVDTPGLDRLSILVVDDEEDARDLVSRILRDRGASVRTAGSAREALVELERGSPDMLISDIGMPGMDGYELIRAIRARADDPKRPLPAIALTAFARSEDRTRALLAGYQSHVAKPVEPGELVAAVASLRYAISQPDLIPGE